MTKRLMQNKSTKRS